MLKFAPLLLSTQLLMVADQPPRLDVEPSCQAAHRTGLNGRSRDICMNEENTARATLGEKWTQFKPAHQARCNNLVILGGPPSYVELLTCLEMAEQADKIPDTDKLQGTTGSAIRER